MNRKHNPMVALVALLLLTVLLLCAGCSDLVSVVEEKAAAAEGVTAAEPETSPRFIIEHHESNRDIKVLCYEFAIITDTETGVQYLWANEGYGGGLTVLQPAPKSEAAQ